MEYIYSALILNSVGKPVSEEGITEILKAAGVTPDPARVKSLVSSLEGVNIEEAIKASAAAMVAAPAASSEPTKKEEKKEEKQEEKKEEKSEEDAVAGLGALFG